MQPEANTIKSNPFDDADLTTFEWARLCRVEMMRTTHDATRAFLIELLAEFEALSGNSVDLHPDDRDLQDAAADRLISLASKRWFRPRQ